MTFTKCQNKQKLNFEGKMDDKIGIIKDAINATDLFFLLTYTRQNAIIFI